MKKNYNLFNLITNIMIFLYTFLVLYIMYTVESNFLNYILLITLFIINVIIYFYKRKINDKERLILKQQNQLLEFKDKLKQQIEEKTTNLLELNESLEMKVQEKVDELMQKDKLLTTQSKQAVMGEMISMIAHQWRQPLSTITLYISNLKVKRLLGKPVNEEETYETLDKISDMSIYLSETIDDFKTFFQPDKELGEIDIYVLLERAIGFTMPRIEEFKIEVIVKENEQIMITTYINELVQVILNLLNNSVDALSNVKKENKKITFDIEEVGDKLLIYVSDNANGISDENLSRIFEPYFSTKGSNGTGLGLYMSQMILQKQFNGDISVETSKEGSTFIVEISKNLI